MYRCRIYGPQTEAPGKDHVELWDSTDQSYEEARPNGKFPDGKPLVTVFGHSFDRARKDLEAIKLREKLVNGVDWEIRGIA